MSLAIDIDCPRIPSTCITPDLVLDFIKRDPELDLFIKRELREKLAHPMVYGRRNKIKGDTMIA